MDVNTRIFSDGMVIQRGESISFSGHETSGGTIDLIFQERRLSTVANTDGSWQLEFAQPEVGGPWDIVIENKVPGRIERRLIKDVLVGDVYLMSGQSNMGMDVASVHNSFCQEIEDFSSDYVRHFKINTAYDYQQTYTDTDTGEWVRAQGFDKLSFGAVGFFMAARLYREQQIPIGLIQTAVPGCPIESFLNTENYRKFFPEGPQLPAACRSRADMAAQTLLENRAIADAEQALLAADDTLAEARGGQRDWQTCQIPINLLNGVSFDGSKRTAEENGSGVIWFRKEIEITPEELSFSRIEGAATIDKCQQQIGPVLELRLIIDNDTTYFNGEQVGKSLSQYASRRYQLPVGLLKPGKNLIEVRVVYTNGICRFWREQPYQLTTAVAIHDLKGDWEMSIGYHEDSPFPRKVFFEYLPSGVYNAMLAPVMSYKAAALLWYQGESNANDPERYRDKFAVLIEQIRAEMAQPELAAYFIQLPDYDSYDSVQNDKWSQLQAQQEQAARTIPNTYMVVSRDVGDITNLHPQDKKTLGERIADLILS